MSAPRARPPSVEVVIPVRPGSPHLAAHLPGVLAAVAEYRGAAGGAAGVAVVLDGPDDGATVPAEHRPSLRIETLVAPAGFGPAVNHGVRTSTADLVLLLNDDVVAPRDLVTGLARHFPDTGPDRDATLFAVAAASRVPRLGGANESPTRPVFAGGFLDRWQPELAGEDLASRGVQTVLHASGGFALFDRAKFLALDGFSELYRPFLWEDVDLSWRAWRRGWRVLYDPRVAVTHLSHGTIARVASDERVRRIELVNRLLFNWRHLRTPLWIAVHLAHLAKACVVGLATRSRPAERELALALPHALRRVPEVLRARWADRALGRGATDRAKTDRDILRAAANRPDPAAHLRDRVPMTRPGLVKHAGGDEPRPYDSLVGAPSDAVAFAPAELGPSRNPADAPGRDGVVVRAGPVPARVPSAAPVVLGDQRPSVLLVDPPGPQAGLNVGIAYLATVLRDAGYRVRVLDLVNHLPNLRPDDLAAFVRAEGFDVVGHSIKTATYRSASAYVRAVAAGAPAARQIAGGAHPTVYAAGFLADRPEIELIALGEAEETVVEAVRTLAAPHAELRGVPGTATLRGGGYHETPHAPARAVDRLPFPDWDLVPGIDFRRQDYPIVTTRGCPYACSFCAVPTVSGTRWRYRSAVNVADELAQAKARWGAVRFNVYDDNFTQSMRHATRVCQEIAARDLGFTFACGNGLRADRLRPELVAAMRAAGLVLACIGVESADPTVFEAVNKGETLDDVRNGIRLLREAGVEVVGFFIVGLPHDTYERSLRAIEFVRETGLSGARFGLLAPYPGMAAWDWVTANARWLADWRDGVHFGPNRVRPLFDTPDFSGHERLRAYERLNLALGLWSFVVDPDAPVIERKLALAWKLLRHDPVRLVREALRALSLDLTRGRVDVPALISDRDTWRAHAQALERDRDLWRRHAESLEADRDLWRTRALAAPPGRPEAA